MANSRYLFALVAAAWLTQLQGQAIYKCVGKDGKITYSNSSCANAKQIRNGSSPPAGSPADDAVVAAKLPNMPQGKWGWKGVEGASCGDPLERTRALISSTYGSAGRFGCTAQLYAPGPGNTVYILDCPADATEGGVEVRKGKLEITVFSPSPDTVRVSTKEPGGETQVFEANRLGDC